MKKVIIIGLSVIIVLGAIIGIYFWQINNDDKKIARTFDKYMNLLVKQKYEDMYEMISEQAKENFSEDKFVTRNKNIYSGIDAINIVTELKNVEKLDNEVKITYHQKMDVSLGNIEFDNVLKLKKENNQYKVDWSSKLIFPELEENYKVKVSSVEAKRGEILDRNGVKLAENGQVANVGIVPGKLGENRDENIQKISELLDVPVDYINKQLSASYVEDNMFIPIKKISKENLDLKSTLLEIPGVKIKNIDSRVYPLSYETAHIIGYVQTINAEELEKNADKGYNSQSIIGKTGLELVYEDTLKGVDGKEIYIVNEEGDKVKSLAIRESKNGNDIKLTIDSKIQKEMYEQMKDDKGLFVCMNPETGEILSLISVPSYDINSFVLGISNKEWEELSTSEDKPLYNKTLQTYCPGSTFKPLTASIGLNSEKLTTNTTFSYSGLSWQKDEKWGDNFITTLTPYYGAKNIANALLHSDNIFFAQAVLQIGKDTFCEGLNNFGFNEKIDFPLSIKKSQYSNSNTISGEKKLADSGYGQGDILVNPIHMAMIYSAFYNNGNMIKPTLIYGEEKSYWKENVISEETAKTIQKDLIQVVENPGGTANDMRIYGLTIAGKTGTAELKKSKDDTESGTLGWFDCFTIGRPENDLLMIGMVENTQDNMAGGSHYVIKKIKNLLRK